MEPTWRSSLPGSQMSSCEMNARSYPRARPMPWLYALPMPVPSWATTRVRGKPLAISTVRSVDPPSMTRTSTGVASERNTLSRASPRQRSPFRTPRITLTALSEGPSVCGPSFFMWASCGITWRVVPRSRPSRLIDVVDRVEEQEILHVRVYVKRRGHEALATRRPVQGMAVVGHRRGPESDLAYELLLEEPIDERGERGREVLRARSIAERQPPLDVAERLPGLDPAPDDGAHLVAAVVVA